MSNNSDSSYNPFLAKNSPQKFPKSLLTNIIPPKFANQIKKIHSQTINYDIDHLNENHAKVDNKYAIPCIGIDKTSQRQNEQIVKKEVINRVMNQNIDLEKVQKNVCKSQNEQLKVITVLQKLENYRKQQQVYQKQIFNSFDGQQHIVLKSQQQIQTKLLLAKKQKLLAKCQQINKQISDSKIQRDKLIYKRQDMLKQIQSLQMPKIQQYYNQNRKYTLPTVGPDRLLKIQSLSHLEMPNFKQNSTVIIQNQKQANQHNQSLKLQLSQLKKEIILMAQVNPEYYRSIVTSQAQQNRYLQQLKMRSKMLQEQYKMLKKNKMANRPKQLGYSKLQMGFNLQAKGKY